MSILMSYTFGTLFIIILMLFIDSNIVFFYVKSTVIS